MWVRALGITLLLATGAASAATVATVSSPGNVLKVDVSINDEGRPGYAVSRGGVPVITESRLGFILADAPKLERNFKATGSATRGFAETWEQPWGERRYVRNRFNELKVALVETSRARAQSGRGVSRLRRRARVSLRVSGAVAAAPGQHRRGAHRVRDRGKRDGLVDSRRRMESLRIPVPEDAIGRSRAGTHADHDQDRARSARAVHEAALVDYSAMWLRRVTGTRLQGRLVTFLQGARVRRTAPFTTPWRTLQIADDAAGLYMSDLILNLNEPNKLGDVSWVKPGKYVGIWWAMHLGEETWASGPQHGATTANASRYIDFAAPTVSAAC